MLSLRLFLFLCSVLSAAAQDKGNKGLKCYTISGYKPGYDYLPRTTVTKTLKPTTITLTRTKTETTTSVLAPVTDTITETETSTSTETDSTTSTVPAPAGFTPITESSGYTSANVPGAKRRAVVELLFGRAQTSSAAHYPKGYSPKTYPKPRPRSVRCVTTVQSTKTVRTVTTTTSTSIIVPIPVTTTETTTTTTTTTTTSTSTFYAACATNNVLGPVANPPGLYLQGVGNSDPNGSQANVEAASAYDCCVICLTGAVIDNCENSVYDADSKICNPIGGNTDFCPVPGQQSNPFNSYVLLSSQAFNRYDSNGPCGTVGPDPAV